MGVINHFLTGMILHVDNPKRTKQSRHSKDTSNSHSVSSPSPGKLGIYTQKASQPQLMLNCWFGARWFGFLGSPLMKGIGILWGHPIRIPKKSTQPTKENHKLSNKEKITPSDFFFIPHLYCLMEVFFGRFFGEALFLWFHLGVIFQLIMGERVGFLFFWLKCFVSQKQSENLKPCHNEKNLRSGRLTREKNTSLPFGRFKKCELR